MSTTDDLETIAYWLDKEAEHWRIHPDYFTPQWDSAHFAGKSYKEAHSEIKQWLAERVNQQRGTHTDIVLRDRAAQIRRHARTMQTQAADLIELQAAEIERLSLLIANAAEEFYAHRSKLDAKIERLQRLAKFARHADWCQVKPCDCGLYAEAAGEPT